MLHPSKVHRSQEQLKNRWNKGHLATEERAALAQRGKREEPRPGPDGFLRAVAFEVREVKLRPKAGTRPPQGLPQLRK